jgi:hypothetical protein
MSNDWRKYPFRLVHNDSALDFPAAEGEHVDQESDTWFIAGELTATTGRSFAFLTIFNKNRPGGTVVADFYTMALFDCDTGEYGTYTDYDMPPKNMQPDARPKMSMATGYLDIHYESTAGTAAWTACRDDNGELVPYTYRVSLFGVDQAGQPMELDLTVTPTRAPVPVGADTLNGKIMCFGQHDTYSYFQTGMAMHGTLRWGELYERVSGSAGHVDRQWFPKYAGGGGTGGDPRARSHEWRTINLDNGVDISIWRQFDRTDGNALQPFSGATVSYPDPAMAPECAEDRIRSGRWCGRWRRTGSCPTATGYAVPHCNWISPASRWCRLRRMACRSNTWKGRIATAERCVENRSAASHSTNARWRSTGIGS